MYSNATDLDNISMLLWAWFSRLGALFVRLLIGDGLLSGRMGLYKFIQNVTIFMGNESRSTFCPNFVGDKVKEGPSSSEDKADTDSCFVCLVIRPLRWSSSGGFDAAFLLGLPLMRFVGGSGGDFGCRQDLLTTTLRWSINSVTILHENCPASA